MQSLMSSQTRLISSRMNFIGCANCLLHGWKQVEDPSTLQRCTRCKLIQYCGRECQAEHWERIHKKQCRYFADPVKAQMWGHNQEDCAICLQAAQVGKAEICQATNPNYECILKEKFPTHMYHPHPFPVTGQPGNTYEKVVIVLWQLLKKFELSQPEVIRNCQGKLLKVFAELKAIRLDIWKGRKISRHSDYLLEYVPSLLDLLDDIKDKVGSDESMEDLFRVIQLVDGMYLDVCVCEIFQVLINPLADIPPDLHTIVSQALKNSSKYLAMANQLLDALINQVVPYQDLVRIVSGDSLQKRCSFCSVKITITSIANMSRFCGNGPFVEFNCLSMEIYCCGTPNCIRKANPMMMMQVRLLPALVTTVAERVFTRCDFCSKLPPRKGGHRCSKCLTVVYCSVTCRDQDRKIHKDFCREDVEERKKKFGSSGRRDFAREFVDRMEEMALEELKESKSVQVNQRACEVVAQGAREVVSEFKLKDATKKAKK